jgi:hypothetical protein
LNGRTTGINLSAEHLELARRPCGVCAAGRRGADPRRERGCRYDRLPALLVEGAAGLGATSLEPGVDLREFGTELIGDR